MDQERKFIVSNIDTGFSEIRSGRIEVRDARYDGPEGAVVVIRYRFEIDGKDEAFAELLGRYTGERPGVDELSDLYQGVRDRFSDGIDPEDVIGGEDELVKKIRGDPSE